VRDGEVYVTLVTGETGIAPGQACVLYSEDGADAQVLGAGLSPRRCRRRWWREWG